MRVKHKTTNTEFSIDYLDWYNKYIKTKKYKDYEILNYNGVVELLRIKDNGNVIKNPQSLKVAKDCSLKFPKEFNYNKELSFETYDKWLVSKSYKSSQNHFLNKIRYIIFEKIRPKTILKPIWKSIIVIILGGLGTLLGYILVEFYKSF